MEKLSEAIENHYHKPQLFEDILGRLKDQGVDLAKVTRADIAGVDEFHVRGAAVSKELAQAIELNGVRVLDVGCGLGGPCRMLADEFNCITTGIDISAEFIRTAHKLSNLVGLSGRTSFKQADANNLPFDNGSFDVVWTQHVQMNIPNKKQFYSEISRVLISKGHFIYYDIFKNGNGSVNYPMPWASDENLSFLFTTNELENILTELGFTCVQSVDQTKAGIDFFEKLMARLEAFGPPKMGLNVLMGASTKIKIGNLLAGLQGGNLMLQSGVYKKQNG